MLERSVTREVLCPREWICVFDFLRQSDTLFYFMAKLVFSGRKRSLILAFDSKTGNVRRFVNKLNLEMPAVQIQEDLLLEEPFILVTYTTGFGQVPDKVQTFLKQNHSWMRGVAASGNRNWGTSFAKSADTISSAYQVPLLAKFELSGTMRDLELFKSGVASIATH